MKPAAPPNSQQSRPRRVAIGRVGRSRQDERGGRTMRSSSLGRSEQGARNGYFVRSSRLKQSRGEQAAQINVSDLRKELIFKKFELRLEKEKANRYALKTPIGQVP